MWVWTKPGSRNWPAASIEISCDVEGSGPTEAILPSRTDTAPFVTAMLSFIVRMVALRMSVDVTAAQPKHSGRHRDKFVTPASGLDTIRISAHL